MVEDQDFGRASEATQVVERLRVGLADASLERRKLIERQRDLRQNLRRMEGLVQRVVDAGLWNEARSILVQEDALIAELDDIERRHAMVAKLEHDLLAARRRLPVPTDEPPAAPAVTAPAQAEIFDAAARD